MKREPALSAEELNGDEFLQTWLREEVKSLAEEVISGKVDILTSAEIRKMLLEADSVGPTRGPKFK